MALKARPRAPLRKVILPAVHILKLPWIIWITLSIVLTALYIWYGQVTPHFYSNGQARAGIGIAAGCIGIAMTLRFPKLKGKRAVLVILLVSLAVRLAVFPADSSDDVNRYLWEGKLYSQGISPYLEPAEHSRYTEHRDFYWENMNHKDKITAYPPLSLHFFSFINRLSYSPGAYKISFLLADLILIAVILSLLHHAKKPLHWALFYALSPIPILAFVAEGHFDVIMVLFLMLSLLAYSKKCFILCGTAIGLAVATKIMVVIAAPMILLKTGKKGIISAAVAGSLPFLIHFGDTLQMIHGLVSFGSTNNFNGSVNQVINNFLGASPQLASHLGLGLFSISWMIGFWLSLKDQLWLGLAFCLGGLLIFAPVVHFWYFTWLLPFVALRPSPAWLSFSVTAPLYFLVHSAYLETGLWDLPVWARWAFWLPFFMIALIGLPEKIRTISHLLRGTDPKPPLKNRPMT